VRQQSELLLWARAGEGINWRRESVLCASPHPLLVGTGDYSSGKAGEANRCWPIKGCDN
jgi:hypothetical protein